MMEEMLYISHNSQESPFHLIGHTWLFLDYFMRSTETVRMKQDGSIRDFYIKEALSFIEQNFQNDISIEDIAACCGLNRSYFGKIFHDTIGRSPQEFLISYRMTKAAELLKITALSIADIGNAVGYPNQLHFSRAFKNVYGMSPRNWRMKNRLIEKSLRPENSRRFFIKKCIYLKCKFISKVCIKLIDLHTYLLHSVTVTDCNCTVILRLKVISDTERSTDLILSAVTFTDISTVIVLTVVLLGKLLVDLLSTLVKLLGKRKHTDLNRCKYRMEMKDCTDIVLLFIQNFLIVSAAEESKYIRSAPSDGSITYGIYFCFFSSSKYVRSWPDTF